MANVITVDPGINLGWAIWDMGTWSRLAFPKAAGVILAKRTSWLENMGVQVSQFAEVLEEHKPQTMHYELPVYFQSAGGQMVAGSGDLVKLCRSVGWLEHLCYSRGLQLREWPVPDWKGQLSKDVVNRRICRVLGMACGGPEAAKRKLEGLGVRTHAWDAVGIGLVAKGLMEKPPEAD